MTTLLWVVFAVFAYYVIGVLLMAAGARVFGGKGTIPTSFSEGGVYWPFLLPVFLGGLVLAIYRTLKYWPDAPEDPPC